MMAFFVIGGLNYDLVFILDRFPASHEKMAANDYHEGPGGSAPNTAYWLGKLGCETEFHGEIACDEFSERCIVSLQTARVKIPRPEASPGVRTRLVVILSTGDDKMMVSSAPRRTAPAAVRESLAASVFGQGDIVHATSRHVTGLEDILAAAKMKGARISIELNGASPALYLDLADFMFCNEDELRRSAAAEDPLAFARRMLETAKATLIVTRGAQGVCIIRGGRELLLVPTEPVTPVDRTGGGDAFNAGFLAAIDKMETLEEAAGAGLALASKVIMHQGARPALEV